MKEKKKRDFEVRACLRCKGQKTIVNWDKAIRPCTYCNGKGGFKEPNKDRILNNCGSNRGVIRSSRPKVDKGFRAYYVWRIARFHGGKDTRMPMCAEMDVQYDPFRPELEEMAQELAAKAFGTSYAGAMIWGRALGVL